MSYSIEEAAAELMLDPEDMEDILAAFFEDAPKLMLEGLVSLKAGEMEKMSRVMHSIKGSALNLRMKKLGALAARAEKNGTLTPQALEEILGQMNVELAAIEKNYHSFYSI